MIVGGGGGGFSPKKPWGGGGGGGGGGIFSTKTLGGQSETARACASAVLDNQSLHKLC